MQSGLIQTAPLPTVPLGDLDPIVAAPLTDAGLTTYTAIKPALPSLVPGSTAAVIGGTLNATFDGTAG
jgi:D-arabinose 1-dehydrogenase-like Zn-dependent alcohol dehydrogenase